MIEYNINDIVKDLKTDRIAKIANKFRSKTNHNEYYYFIVFKNNTGCYRSYKFLIPF